MLKKNAKEETLKTLHLLEDNGIEGIALGEVISYMYIAPFLEAVKENIALLDVKNSVLLVKKVQGSEMSKEFINKVIDSLEQLAKEDKIIFSQDTNHIFLKR